MNKRLYSYGVAPSGAVLIGVYYCLHGFTV